jgi:hypothetical protein
MAITCSPHGRVWSPNLWKGATCTTGGLASVWAVGGTPFGKGVAAASLLGWTPKRRAEGRDVAAGDSSLGEMYQWRRRLVKYVL